MAWLHAVLDVPDAPHDTTSDFWGQVLGWPPGAAWEGHPELRSFEPPRGSAYVHLQRIDGPPRVHLDVESDDPGTTVLRAVELGAELVGERDEWVTLASPGGLLFCVLRARDREAPPATAWPDGHRSRLVQVCID